MMRQQDVINRTWLLAMVGTGLMIVVAAIWSTLNYGDLLNQIMNVRGVRFFVAGLFLLAFIAILLRGIAYLAGRWRKGDDQLTQPSSLSFAWVTFQLACMLAVIVLGAIALASIPLGHSRQFFQAFTLVLVGSAVLFFAGGVVRNFSRAIRSFR